jgi:phosphopantetheinyl transferase
VRVAAVMNSSTSFGTDADVYIYTDKGQVLAQFKGISSRRITLNNEWKSQVNDPIETYFSAEIESLQKYLPQAGTAILSADQLPDDEATTTWCLDYVLSPSEQNYYQGLPNARRKREWLTGRLAAKEAVRRLLAGQGHNVCAADVIIEYAQNGQPQAVGAWQTLLPANLSISITHKADRAAAVAAFVAGVGIDLETLSAKESGFEKLALLPQEIEFIDSLPADQKNALIVRLWSAKEALGKALGSGLSANPRSLCATLIKASGDYAQFEVAGPAPGSSPSVVHSIIMDDLVLSCTVLLPVYSTAKA